VLYFGTDPFCLEPNYVAVARGHVAWRPSVVQSDRPRSAVIASITAALGREIGTLFARVFTSVGGSWVSSLRPSAAEWHAGLDRAASWVVGCRDHEYVGLRRRACPFDGTLTTHARMEVRGRRRVIDQDDLAVTGAELGLSSGPDPVVRFSRRNRALVVQALNPMRIDRLPAERSPLYLDPRAWSVGELRPGRYVLRIWQRDGWGRPADVVLEEPAR
jgi:hypothetical protein